MSQAQREALDSLTTRAAADPFLTPGGLRTRAADYLDGAAPRSDHWSPAGGRTAQRCPPLMSVREQRQRVDGAAARPPARATNARATAAAWSGSRPIRGSAFLRASRTAVAGARPATGM